MKRIILYTILLVAIIACPLFIVVAHQDQFFGSTYQNRYPQLKKLYYASQYMIKKNPGIIPDQTLEAFAGGAFLKGLNPILIVHDQPPLGRYITGLSILLFDNENTLTIFYFLVSLFALFLVSKLVLRNTAYALFPLVIFANEPLMLEKFISTPLLELIQLPFVVFTIYFFLKFIEAKKKSYLWATVTAICLGGVISTRFFILGAVLLFSQMVFLLLKRRHRSIVTYCLALPFTFLVLELAYLKVIFDYHSIIKPISVQKYMLAYHSSKFENIGTVWDLLLFNRWHTWWGSWGVTSDVNWIIAWPISAVTSIVLGALGLIKKIKVKDPEWVLLSWCLFYMIMLSTGINSVRYFLPLLPFFYILAFALIFRVTIIRRFFES